MCETSGNIEQKRYNIRNKMGNKTYIVRDSIHNFMANKFENLQKWTQEKNKII